MLLGFHLHHYYTGIGIKANYDIFQQSLIIAEADPALRQQQDELAWEDSGFQTTEDTDRDTVSSLGHFSDANFCLCQTGTLSL